LGWNSSTRMGTLFFLENGIACMDDLLTSVVRARFCFERLNILEGSDLAFSLILRIGGAVSRFEESFLHFGYV
jgi:hypothetical protein